MLSKGFLLLLWVFGLHLAGIYLFTRGFLLTRLSLLNTSSCTSSPFSCSLPPTHNRAVVLIIDALRFDFISPDPPSPPDPFHHNVLTLPRDLTKRFPERSWLFNAHADPPTTTLQRIKGLTTGSLPTFVDMGSNFGGVEITEDSLVKQLTAHGKKIAFMGDDTWTTVFPSSFQHNLTFPYDSFNVEDLHTVDNGVIEHLFPTLSSSSWDVIIGHFLGVDHTGHRLGPSNPTMKSKLLQMNDVLTKVVESLDDDTLLVVLGDHGMDRKGDHGGDGELETSCAVWVYSKGVDLNVGRKREEGEVLSQKKLFPGTTEPHRSIQQIDLVPTLSLLLGLPIPFNNLGTIIPELFSRPSSSSSGELEYARALQINAEQIKTYLDTYRASSSGSDLDGVWDEVVRRWDDVVSRERKDGVESLATFTRFALEECRALWAQFNIIKMGLGLALILLGLLGSWGLYVRLGVEKEKGDLKEKAEHWDWEFWVGDVLKVCLKGAGLGVVAGLLVYLVLVVITKVMDGKTMDAFDFIIFFTPFSSSLSILWTYPPPIPTRTSLTLTTVLTSTLAILPLILHTLSFFSNSFTVWEDHIVLFLLISTIVPSLLTGLRAPTSRLRTRIIGFSLLFALCVRLMAISTVCREEQQPFCHVTFFASSSLPSPPPLILLLCIPTSLVLPWVMKKAFLGTSKSDRGVAGLVLPYLLSGVLLAGNGYWVLEYLESGEVFGSGWEEVLRSARTLVARCAIGGLVAGGFGMWWLVPTCLQIETSTTTPGSTANGATPENKQVTVLGFGNAFGSPYFIFWTLWFGLVFVVTQLTGQVVLALAALALLSYLEVVDGVRDVRNIEEAVSSATPSSLLEGGVSGSGTNRIRFSEVVPLALLAIHTFHTTGHQHTIPSIQWKTAFILTSTLTYPLSPLLVMLNSFGPIFLMPLSLPLLALWNFAPLPHPSSSSLARKESVRASLGVMLYFGVCLVGSAGGVAWLRRHLMVWKIFAPRFMSAAAGLVVVDLGVLVGYGVGVGRVVGRVGEMFDGWRG
ncbi:hypothetical protein JAAARDRAFT_179059 [Jaapia argillacea MUCL 33604]|uniref:Uncharacterized protein n=1 Tax=Jaapia argillacea MUCL 33604 TaxID=933084 RepID=A0A067Q459_9AGAM|nr:hypothetical protein JAAARDRAFT_179059 [Jaapia argillacea MUCL 33604]